MKIIQLTNKTEYQTMGYVLQAKTGEVIVVDGGHGGNEEELANIIRSLGGHVSLWLITHPHDDHHDAVMRIFREYKDITCEKLGSSLLPAEWLAGQKERRELDDWEAFLPEVSDIFFEVRRGQTFSVGSVTVDVLTGANPDILVNTYNNQSCVYRMKEDDFTMIFLGDLGIEGGERFLSLCPDVRCDGVQMAHHGQQGVKEDVYQSLLPTYAFWPTPRWLWDNCHYLGGGEPGCGPFKTPEVEAWAAKLGCINITSFDETTVFDTQSRTARPYWEKE